MASYTIKKTYETKQVKNLGWVIRHAQNNTIQSVVINKHNGTYGIGGNLTVYFKDLFFEADFADYSVLCDWVKSRKSWRGVKLIYKLYNQTTNVEVLK